MGTYLPQPSWQQRGCGVLAALGAATLCTCTPPPIMVTLEVGSVWGSWDCCSGDEGSEAHIHVQDTLTSVRKSTGGAIEQPKK
jgi:hypothetical protein